MKVKCLFLVALVLALTSIGFAQSKTKADYIGSWFNEDGDELNISPTKMVTLHHTANQTDTYRDVAGAGKKKIYYLQIVKTSVEISLPKFLSISINKNSGSKLFGDKEKQVDELTITHYKTLADMRAGKNPQGDELWTRISKTNSDGSAQSKTKAGYLGEWFSEHGDELAISATKIVLSHAAVTQNYKFRDVTGAGGKTIYYLQMIGNSDKDELFSKFCSLSIEKGIVSPFAGGDGKNVDVLTITSYKTRADMKAGKNALNTDKWIRGR